MLLPALILNFAEVEKFPITVKEVRDWIFVRTDLEKIEFWPVNTDPKVLKGSFALYDPLPGPYASAKSEITITYSENQSDCAKRFVCCKELMHALDSPSSYTDETSIEKLTQNLTSPEAMAELPEDYRADKIAVMTALCVLAPLKAVTQLRAAVESGQMTKQVVAEFFRIPLVYINYILSDRYAEFYKLAIAPAQARKG